MSILQFKNSWDLQSSTIVGIQWGHQMAQYIREKSTLSKCLFIALHWGSGCNSQSHPNASHLVLKRGLVAIENTGVEQKDFVCRQSQQAVSQPWNHLSIWRTDRLKDKRCTKKYILNIHTEYNLDIEMLQEIEKGVFLLNGHSIVSVSNIDLAETSTCGHQRSSFIYFPTSNYHNNYLNLRPSVYSATDGLVKLCNGAFCGFCLHLQAGVEAPGLLLLLLRRGIQPHKAIIPQDDGGTTWQVVEVCFLPLDQRRRQLYQHPLAQLVKGNRNKLVRKLVNEKGALNYRVKI